MDDDANSLSLAEIMAAVEQLYVAEKWQLFRVLLRDPALKAFRELKFRQRKRIKAQKAIARPHNRPSRKAA